MPNTIAVTATLTLDSSIPAPPYNVGQCKVDVQYDDGTSATLQGWGEGDLGTPQSSGAPFAVTIVDANNASPASAIQSWAVTCIPRSPTTDASPFGTNQNTISGSAPPGNGVGTFELNLSGSPKIKNAGTWDWSVMVQVVCADGTVKCFASDPEMKVDT